MTCFFVGFTMSMLLQCSDNQVNKQEAVQMACIRHLRASLRAVRSQGIAISTDAAYGLLSHGMPEHATKVGEQLFEACKSATRLLRAHERRTECFFALYKDGRAMPTEVFETKVWQSLSRYNLEGEVDKQFYEKHRNQDSAILQLLARDEDLQETEKACTGVSDSLKEYNKLSTPTELAQVHITYTYHMGKEFGKCFLDDPSLQDAVMLKQDGRLVHNTQNLATLFYEEIKKSHLPSVLRERNKSKNQQ